LIEVPICRARSIESTGFDHWLEDLNRDRRAIFTAASHGGVGRIF